MLWMGVIHLVMDLYMTTILYPESDVLKRRGGSGISVFWDFGLQDLREREACLVMRGFGTEARERRGVVGCD